jgi:hypothetical protein
MQESRECGVNESGYRSLGDVWKDITGLFVARYAHVSVRSLVKSSISHVFLLSAYICVHLWF